MGDSIKDAFQTASTGGIKDVMDKLKPKEPALPPDRVERDEEAERAKQREKERLRQGAGRNSTRKSGSVAETLNASIGKTTLGGVR